MMVFCPEHPKWDQNPKFLPLSETPLCAESLPRAGVLNMSETDTEKSKFIYSFTPSVNANFEYIYYPNICFIRCQMILTKTQEKFFMVKTFYVHDSDKLSSSVLSSF